MSLARRWRSPGIALARCGATLAIVSALASSCRELPVVRQGECGNAVIDGGEDCDTFAPQGQACGLPGTAVACRFHCGEPGDAAGPACPDGWKCGTDTICRSATETFEPFDTEIEASVARVLLGDFTGSRKRAILGMGEGNAVGAAYPRLFYLGDGGAPEEAPLLGFPIVSPRIADVSADGNEDLVFSVLGGIGVLLGRPTPGLNPVTYPITSMATGSFGRAYTIEPYPLSPLDQGVVVMGGDGTHPSFLAPLGDMETQIALLPGPVTELAGEPAIADVVPGDDSPCGEMVFAYKGQRDVWMVDPCEAGGSWSTDPAALRIIATLPAGATVLRGVFLADVDGDQVLDLTVAAAQGSQEDVFVAFGCGDGEFCAYPNSPSDLGKGVLLPVVASSCEEDVTDEQPALLAVADLNADGLADVVTNTSIFAVESVQVEVDAVRASICPIASKLVGEWTTVRVADLNRDGLLDVVAGSASELDVDFFAGTGLDRMNQTRLPTEAPVEHLAIGDFDGDLVQDVAAGLRGGANDGLLSIAYGRLSNAPEPFVRIAHLSTISQLISAHIDLSDAVEELAVVSGTGRQDMQSVTVFISAGGRQLLAPYGLQGHPTGPGSEELSGTALAIATGDFVGGSHPDLGILALDDSCTSERCAFRLWIVEATDSAHLAQSRFSENLPANLYPIRMLNVAQEREELAAFLRTVHGEEGAKDELWLVAPSEPWGRKTGVWRVQKPSGEGDWLGSPISLMGESDLVLTMQSEPAVLDLDRNGHVDMVLLEGGEPATRRLVVLWDRGQEGLDFGLPVEISLPAGSPAAFAVIDADADPLPELVVLTAEGAYLVQSQVGAPRELSTVALARVRGGHHIAAGDLDGDGIEDLAVATEGSVLLYRGLAALP